MTEGVAKAKKRKSKASSSLAGELAGTKKQQKRLDILTAKVSFTVILRHSNCSASNDISIFLCFN